MTRNLVTANAIKKPKDETDKKNIN